ncbi:MAG TPA: PAS domain S-box protein [Candidatus Limnocylindria bacterium]|nr:PAS domain S-box protein [Candidatus Limnocylindria bacterium]
MNEERDEHEQLRSVTLENARSVFLARQRAEEELVRAKEELSAQSERLRVTLASIGDAVITTDTNGRVLSLNRVAQSLSGWTEQDALGQELAKVFRIVNEATRQPEQNPAEEALREGRVVGLANHTLLVARDGTETPIDHSAAPILDEEGRVHGVVLVFRSIADRKRSEAARLNSERELSDFFENASVGMHWVGPDGTVLRVNRAELNLLGYSRDEYVGHHIAEFHADQDVIEDILRRLTAGETIQDYPARMLGKDGSIKHVLIDSSVRWEDGRFVHTRSFTRDMTDRRRAEEAQARLASIVESSQDAIISKTLDSRILTWNAGAEYLFGYRAEEVIGQPITLIIPPERQDEERVILEQLRRGERVEHFETVRVSKSGRRIDVSLTISPIRDGAGRIIGASKIARDVTARKRAEQRLSVQNGVASVLAESANLVDAAPRILRSICESLDWQVGALWQVDEPQLALRCTDIFHVSSAPIPRFEAASREYAFERGVGLPGRIWATGVADWIPDVAQQDNFKRAAVAAAEGLHAALALPIILDSRVLGVMEFFTRAVLEPDQDLLAVMKSVGSHVGQFIERRRAEAALRDSEQRFRLMADAVPSIIWTAGPDGTITYANERWSEYTGLISDQNARGWSELMRHPADDERCVAAWTAALEQGSAYEVEARYRRYDGVYRWFVTRAVPLRRASSEIVQWFGTTTDIDDRKRAEHRTRFLADASAALTDLTDQESTLRKVAGLAVPDFADWCTVDLIEGADGSLRRLAVSHVDPAKVQLVRDLDRKYPSQRLEPRGVRHVVRTGEPEWAASIPDEMLVGLAEGEEHLSTLRSLGLRSYICVPLKSRGDVLGAITFVTAESGRTYGADDVRAAEDLSRRAVMAIENARLLASLREADRRKDEFLAMLSHELRNPLAPIRNAVQIFRAKGSPVPELQWATELIDRQLHHMTRMVDDLLDVSRITQGKVELRKETVELATIVSSAVEASRPLIAKWGHDLTVTIPPRPIHLEVDPTRLTQMVSNLLNNAAKYTGHGGRIALTAEQEGGEVVIRVKDNGIGIPPEMLTGVFDLFTQVDRSVERAEGGLGIGLTLVRRLAEMHGGSVAAHSEGTGRGSEFVLRLPVGGAFRRAARKGTNDDQVQAPPVPLRILVVDDNLDAADSLGMVLRMMGHDVDTAHDGLEAMGAATAFRPDVILLDIGLPKLDGYQVARRIREQDGGAEIVLVALTGWGQEEDRHRSNEAGFDLHMTKPVDFKALQKLLVGVHAGSERPRETPGNAR